MAKATVHVVPPQPITPHIEGVTLELSRDEALHTLGSIGVVNQPGLEDGEKSIYSTLFKALEDAGLTQEELFSAGNGPRRWISENPGAFKY